MTTKKYLLIGVLVAMALMLANGVYALAVSSPYWSDNPLRISPGQSVDLQLVLKNNAGVDDLNVDASIVEGNDVASITDSSTRYLVPGGGEAIVSVQVSVSENSAIGGSYPVKFSFKTVTPGDSSGSVGIGNAIDFSLPVFVVETPKSASTNSMTWYLLAAVVILIIVIAVVMMRRKR